MIDLIVGLGAVTASILFVFTLFALYLSYVTLRVARDNGKLASAPRIVQAVCWTILIVAFGLDIVFNLTVGTIAFLELPSLHRPTFTMRCKKHMASMSWRGRLARWVCEGWLNPFEAGHC